LSAIGKSQALEAQIGSLIIKIKNAFCFASNNMFKRRKSRDLKNKIGQSKHAFPQPKIKQKKQHKKCHKCN